jgi:hypothetical protein
MGNKSLRWKDTEWFSQGVKISQLENWLTEFWDWPTLLASQMWSILLYSKNQSWPRITTQQSRLMFILFWRPCSLGGIWSWGNEGCTSLILAFRNDSEASRQGLKNFPPSLSSLCEFTGGAIISHKESGNWCPYWIKNKPPDLHALIFLSTFHLCSSYEISS